MTDFMSDGLSGETGGRGVSPELREQHNARSAMYQQGDDKPEDVSKLAFPTETQATPVAAAKPSLPAGLGGQASNFLRKHPQAANALLEWANSIDDNPKSLTIALRGDSLVEFSIGYVKLDVAGPVLTFYQPPSTTGVRLKFGTEVTLKYDDKEVNALCAISGVPERGEFPYPRLAFFLDGE